MSNEVAEPWAAAMIAAGFTDPRYKDRDVPSMRQLADAAKTRASTISHMMAGTRETGGDVIDRVAAALNLDPTEVGRWVGRARSAPKRFEPHRDADLLTSEEQNAVNELIRLLALSKRRGGEGREDDPAAKKVPTLSDAREARRRKIIEQGQPQKRAGYGDDEDEPTPDQD